MTCTFLLTKGLQFLNIKHQPAHRCTHVYPKPRTTSHQPSSNCSVTHRGGKALCSHVNRLQRAVSKGKLVMRSWKGVKGHLITGGVIIYSECDMEDLWEVMRPVQVSKTARSFWLGEFLNFRMCGIKFCWLQEVWFPQEDMKISPPKWTIVSELVRPRERVRVPTGPQLACDTGQVAQVTPQLLHLQTQCKPISLPLQVRWHRWNHFRSFNT